MITVICAAVAMTQSSADYRPHGPKIRFTMASRKSFVITTDPQSSPKTVSHILGLVRRGFYDGQRVHRVENWVTQWGDPLSRRGKMTDPKMGDGGSGKDVPFEMSEVDFGRGVVGVASEGLQRGGDSQLFVLKKDTFRLYHSYAVVGRVTDGMSVVDGIEKGDRIASARVEGDQGRQRKRQIRHRATRHRVIY